MMDQQWQHNLNHVCGYCCYCSCNCILTNKYLFDTSSIFTLVFLLVDYKFPMSFKEDAAMSHPPLPCCQSRCFRLCFYFHFTFHLFHHLVFKETATLANLLCETNSKITELCRTLMFAFCARQY